MAWEVEWGRLWEGGSESGVGFLLYKGVTERKRRRGGEEGPLYSEHRGVVDVVIGGGSLVYGSILSCTLLILHFHGPYGAHVKLAIDVRCHSSTIGVRMYCARRRMQGRQDHHGHQRGGECRVSSSFVV